MELVGLGSCRTTCTLLDADKAWEALASNSSSFMLQDGQVRVSSTRRENPLYISQTGDRNSGGYSLTSISEITATDGGDDYLSWGGDETDDADDDMITYPPRNFNMRPSNALRGAGPMSTRRSSDGDPPASLLVAGGGFCSFGFAALDVNASSNLGELESDSDFSLPTAL